MAEVHVQARKRAKTTIIFSLFVSPRIWKQYNICVLFQYIWNQLPCLIKFLNGVFFSLLSVLRDKEVVKNGV
jgi:hypothetical protein